MSSERLYIIDGYGLIYRSYFAFINRPMTDPEGRNISALFGFFRMFFSIMNKERPTHLAVAMDAPGPTFRHELFDAYKANREKTPEDLHAQIPLISRILEAASIPVIAKTGYEADDVIATMAKKASEAGYECVIVSSDKDLLQLVSGHIQALRPVKGDMLHVDRDGVHELFGIWPEQIRDYLSLIGDSADNIPGVKGIGPKSAVRLLSSYESLDGIFEHLDELSPALKKKLSENREVAYISRDLVELAHDDALSCDLDRCAVSSFSLKEMVPFFQDIGSRSLAASAAEGTEAPVLEDRPSGVSEDLRGEGSYEAVTDLQELEQLVVRMKEAVYVALDVETDDIDPMKAHPVGISISVESKRAYYIPMYAGGQAVLEENSVRDILKPVLEDPALHIIGQNIKYDYKVLRRWGITIANLYFDTMIAAWLLDSSASSYSLDKLAAVHLEYETTKFKDVVPKGSLFPEVDISAASEYAAEDADITFRLYTLFSGQLAERALSELLGSMEMPVLRILADMEYRGMLLMTENLRQYGMELAERIDLLEQQIYQECGQQFNVRSTKQLQEILFVQRGLEPIKKTKTGYSTDTSVLEELAKVDIVPQWIVEHRGLTKLKNTYVDALPLMVNSGTGRIHTNFAQTGTATGRLSSRNPNLQNIPIRNEDGRKIREAFVPQDGCQFLSADYAQIELVVLAHFADDPGLKKAFIEGGDVHRQTGALIFDTPLEEVSDEQRRIAKTINFGVMYGMSAFRLSRELGISRTQAASFIEAYFSRYSGIRRFIETTVHEAEENGMVRTMAGHERKIAGITSRNRTEKSGAERIAVNTPIQGSAADIMKQAMIDVDAEIRKRALKTRMVLQVHDELIFEVPEAEIEIVRELVQNKMEHAVSLNVPLRVSIETGMSWGEMH